jgi:hypothetical protein
MNLAPTTQGTASASVAEHPARGFYEEDLQAVLGWVLRQLRTADDAMVYANGFSPKPLPWSGAFKDAPGCEKKNGPNCAAGLHTEMRDGALATCDNYQRPGDWPAEGISG